MKIYRCDLCGELIKDKQDEKKATATIRYTEEDKHKVTTLDLCNDCVFYLEEKKWTNSGITGIAKKGVNC